MSKTKKWFLVKKEWTDNDMLSDEQFGMLIRALYSSSMPKDELVKGLYIAYMQEYARVNNFMVKDAQARSDKAKKAAQARWNNAKPMLEHANIGIDKDIDKDIVKNNKKNTIEEFDKIFQ